MAKNNFRGQNEIKYLMSCAVLTVLFIFLKKCTKATQKIVPSTVIHALSRKMLFVFFIN